MSTMRIQRKSLWFVAYVVIICICVGCASSDHCFEEDSKPTLLDVDFENSLGLQFSEFKDVGSLPLDRHRLSTFKKLWEKNRPSKVNATDEYKIPKIIHQIWLGPKTRPAGFKKWEETWKDLHPDWEYHLWTDAEVAKLNLNLKDLMDKAPNYGQKSDILRCELLERFGGIYVDIDYECFKPFDEVAKKYDFFASFEPPLPKARFGMKLQICNSIIGARPHHPILKQWKENMRNAWNKDEIQGLGHLDTIFFRTYNTLGQAIEERFDVGGYTNIVFPPTYLWPISSKWITKYRKSDGKPENAFKRALTTLHLRSAAPFSRVLPETLALHYNASSWVGSPEERLLELQRSLEHIRDEIQNLRTDLAPVIKQMTTK